MKGQRLPRNGPSESQPQIKAMTMKIPVVGRGTTTLSVETANTGSLRTIVDLWNRERSAGKRVGLLIEAFQPIAHRRLRRAIIPDNIAKCYRSVSIGSWNQEIGIRKPRTKQVSLPTPQNPHHLLPRPLLLPRPSNSLHPPNG